jgi:hypothetical protein
MTQPLGSQARHRPCGNAHRVPRLFERSRQLCLRHHSPHFLRCSQLRPVNRTPEVKAATSFASRFGSAIGYSLSSPGSRSRCARSGALWPRRADGVVSADASAADRRTGGIRSSGQTLCSVHITNQPNQKWASWRAEANAFRHTRTMSGSFSFHSYRSSRPGQEGQGRLDGFDRSH